MQTDIPSIKLATQSLSLSFGNKQVLKEINIQIPAQKVTALIGPSGCGKSTLLRCFNRMHDLTPQVNITGKINLDQTDIFDAKFSVQLLRKRVGMVFQKPNPLPKSIYQNLAYGLHIHQTPKNQIPKIVEEALKDSYLWNEVEQELHKPALQLSGGQQQRLCIARAIALSPEVLLMDEPCSALDPISTEKIEALILKLKQHFTVVIVTHNMQQARRIADYVAFMYLGELVEFGTSVEIFDTPQNILTKNYVQGHFG